MALYVHLENKNSFFVFISFVFYLTYKCVILSHPVLTRM